MWGGIGEDVEKQWLKASNIIYMIYKTILVCCISGEND